MVDPRYHFVCSEHGACGSKSIRQVLEDRCCPVCGRTAEVWVGEAPPDMGESSSPAVSLLRAS